MSKNLKYLSKNPKLKTKSDFSFQVSIERTSTQRKTRDPTWNETFTSDLLRNSEEVVYQFTNLPFIGI
jgi:hypothetical protein